MNSFPMPVEVLVAHMWEFLEKERYLDVRLLVCFCCWGQTLVPESVIHSL